MRRAFDAYATPAWLVQGLLASVPEIGGIIFEPCIGDHSLATELWRGSRRVRQVIANDLDRRRAALWHYDAGRDDLWTMLDVSGGADWVITNPPFSSALPILQHAIANARVGVAVLLRLSFLEPVKARAEWLAAHPPQRILVTERASFTGQGTDSATTAWMIWSRAPLSGRPIEVLSGWRPERRGAELGDPVSLFTATATASGLVGYSGGLPD